ncbi:hypothetical protein EUGRSUZ_C02534 [Eucalyptus grandis]|uniref:Leucine zipper homeobox-associated domain-containing protein n=2 Tax=Eucalyptus grandis TaxID=71139 RepID=A0A059CSG9_EUCGR|nr:hypothetical protein EUGRSUZ_C02534 [Eucalyptus grandis]
MIKVEKDPKLSDIRTVDALKIVQTSNKPKPAYLSKILIALLSYGGVPNEFLLDMVENALGDANSVFSSKRAAPRETNSKTRPFFGGVGVNRDILDILVVDLDDDNHVSSPNSTVLSISGKRSERDPHGENEVEAERTSCSCESIEEDGSGGDGARKKLRLSREQSLVLEETFKEHNTLNPCRTKTKQTEVDCEYLKRCCDNLTQENKRLQKEVQELRALKLSPQLYMHMNPPTTLTMCPSCQRVSVPSTSLSPPSSSSVTASVIGLIGPVHKGANSNVSVLFLFQGTETKKVFLFRGTIFEQKNAFGNVCSR